MKLEWNPAIRAAICMLPMFIAYLLGFHSIVPALGQGGFFYSTLALPQKKIIQFIYIFFLVSFGMGCYLIAGNIVDYFWASLFMTFAFSVVVGLISGVRIMAPLAFSLVSIYSVGLSSTSIDNLNPNFLAFSFIFTFCGLISLIPVWNGFEAENIKVASPADNFKTGVRLGIGSVVGLFVANLFNFSKFGWPIAAIGAIVRFNEKESKSRAWSRVIGTIGGSILAIFTFLLISSPIVIIGFGFIYGVLHSLFSSTRLGKTVFFYTATILILYSLNDLSQGPMLSIYRIIYNLVGVLVAVFVVFYPFPRLMKKIDPLVKDFKS